MIMHQERSQLFNTTKTCTPLILFSGDQLHQFRPKSREYGMSSHQYAMSATSAQ